MQPPNSERLALRREMWRRWKETGELPDVRPPLSATERRKRRLWWMDADDDQDGVRPPPRNAAAPLGNGAGEWRPGGSSRTDVSTREAVAA